MSPRNEDKQKTKVNQPLHGYINLFSSDGIKFNIQATKLTLGSPIFRARILSPTCAKEGTMRLDDPRLERAEVLSAAIDIINRDKSIIDIPYHCQLDVIQFFNNYQFVDELRFLKASIHQGLSGFHPFIAFQMAVHLDDIELCGRILAEKAGWWWTPDQWGPEVFGQYLPDVGMFLAGGMSFEIMQSLPPGVYWALARAEMSSMNDPKVFSLEFMRLMRLKDAPAMGPVKK